jgi:hypothetical protein
MFLIFVGLFVEQAFIGVISGYRRSINEIFDLLERYAA